MIIFRNACAALLIIAFADLAVAQVPWVATGYPGAAPIEGEIKQLEVFENGAIVGVVNQGPTIVRTTDNGIVWTLHTAPSSMIADVAVFGGRLYVGTDDQRVLSTADLSGWTAEGIPDDGSTIVKLDADKGLLIVESSNDIYYKISPGSPFLKIPDSLGSGRGALTTYGQELLYLDSAGFWRSASGSNIWTRISDGYAAEEITVIRDSIYISGRRFNSPHILSSKIGPLDFDTLVILGGNMIQKMYTRNDTVLIALRDEEIHQCFNRKDLLPPLRRAGDNLNDMIIDEAGRYFVADRSGIFFSDDRSQNWTKVSVRLEANTAIHLLSLPNNVVVAATAHGFIMASTNGGDTWTTQSDLRTPATLLAMTPAGTMLVGREGNLLASRDLGRNFVGSNQGFARRTPSAFAIGKNEKLFLGTDSGMYYSTDDGASWYMPKSFLMNIVTGSSFLPAVLSIAIDSANNGIFVGTDKGVLYSLNEGEKYESGWLSKSPIYALAANKYGDVYAGTESVSASDPNKRNFYRGWDVLYSNPAWIDPSNGIEEFDLNHLMLNSRSQIISGVLFSHTSGETWEQVSILDIGSPKRISAQSIDENDIAYVSHNERVYKSAGPKLGRKLERYATSVAVYPNPADREINVSGSEGEVSVLNALGEVVLRTQATEGSIDIHHLSNGAYFCQFRTSSGLTSVPFIVAR